MNLHTFTSAPAKPLGNLAMKPVWIVDDDRSIRWVLETAIRAFA